MLSRRLMKSMALLVLAIVAAVVACTPAAAVSSGGLGSCDLTPVDGGYGVTWPNGCLGFDTWSKGFLITCRGNNDMRWASSPRPTTVYTLRAGDGANNSTDLTSYTPGGFTELHVRTHDLSLRYIGFLMYATNGTDPKTKKETQIGTWKVLPAATGGFQVPSSCGYTAVTHDGADIKPVHARLFFTAPAGSGTLRFRVLLKEGVQNRGNFWYPAQELTLTEGKPLPVQPQNTPAVWGMKLINGTNETVLIDAGRNVSVAVGPEQRVATLSAPGQTCAAACAQQFPATPYCHRQAGADIASSSTLLSAVGLQARCSLPVLAGCPYEGAAHVTQSVTRTTCSFRSRDAKTTCPPWAADIDAPATLFDSGATGSTDRSSPLWVPDVCFTAPAADTQNVCVCTNIKAQQGDNPFSKAAIAAVKVSKSSKSKQTAGRRLMQADSASAAASSAGVSTLALLTVLVAITTGSIPRGQSSMLALCAVAVLVLALTSPVSAHNYVRGVHRATTASVTKPCQERLTTDPHVQIIKDQVFELSFTNGHGVNEGFRKTYFVILHESDYDELRVSGIQDIFRAYLDQAPPEALRSNRPDAAMWERQHQFQQVPNWVLGQARNWKDIKGINETDPLFIKLDKTYDQKSTPFGLMVSPRRNLQVHPDLMAQYGPDRRAAYYNPNFPWIETVDEFMNPYNRDGEEPYDFFSHQADIIRANFPARKGPGNYIVWYSWSGYGDCIDVNVLPGDVPVVNRYGLPADSQASRQAVKLEHAEIRYVSGAATPVRLIDSVTLDASQCIADCAAKSDCSMIQVARVKNAPGTMQRNPNIPWDPSNSNANIANFPDLKDSNYVCYGAYFSRNQDLQVDEDYYRADDPSDPAWYSTTYILLSPGGFINIPPMPTHMPVSFVNAERCLTCDFYHEASNYTIKQAAAWATGLQPDALDMCPDCDLRLSAAPAGESRAAQMSALVGADTPFVGYDAAAEEKEYNDAVAEAKASENAGTSSSSGLFGLGKVPGMLVLIGIIAGGVLLLAGIAFALRVNANRRSSNSDMRKMRTQMGDSSAAELQASPLSTTNFVQW